MGPRQRVVHERAGQKLTILVVDHFLMQSLSDTLHDPPVYLPFDQQRVDDVSAVVHSNVFGYLWLTGFPIQFHHTNVRAEWEREIRGLEEACRFQSRLYSRRKVSGHVCGANNLGIVD